MSRYKIWALGFAALAVLLSDVMCAVVAANYCNLWWGGQYAGCSAPASTAFLLSIPFLFGIALCALLYRALRRREQNTPDA